MIKYFSDRENGTPSRNLEEITIPIWNGIVLIIKEFIANNSLAASFPNKCSDSEEVCGCDEKALNDGIRSFIPNLGVGLDRLEEQETSPLDELLVDAKIDTYSVLDLIEYIYHNLKDAEKVGEYHAFFKHFHYRFEDKGLNKKYYRQKINALLERNGLIYTLTDKGEIHRVIPLPIELTIHQFINTNDVDLNKLVSEAIGKIVLPKKEDRKYALEKLWDAFERSKTYFVEEKIDKKNSMEQVLDKLCNGHKDFRELLNAECKALTEIGNKFQIRHFEKDKIAIEDANEIDYLFYRMFSYIHLFSKCIH